MIDMIPAKIILHHSLTKDSKTVSWGAIRRYHTKTLGWADVGYHFGIELIGDEYEIFVGRLLTVSGAHTRGHNGDSIGICFVGNFDKAAPAEKLWRIGVRFVRSLLVIFDLTWRDIYGHREFAGYKSCPGDQFDIKKFRSEVSYGMVDLDQYTYRGRHS